MSGPTETTYREAVIEALADELEKDESVILLGEDVAAAGGVFKTTVGLAERFGSDRVLDTPIAEQAIVGAAIGSAVQGLRPVAEIMFADFAGVCFDQIANQLAKFRYMTGGQVRVPATIRLAGGGSLGFAAQHSQTVENWFLNVPGLKIVSPSDPASAYGLLRAAIRSDDPVLVFEHKALYGMRGPRGSEPIALGEAALAREGGDVTVVANQLMLRYALEAADELQENHGISAEVIDPRTLVPMDVDAVIRSVEKTNRLVCVQEGPVGGSWAATLIAAVVERGFELLDAPPLAVSADDVPIPYARSLEAATLPSPDSIGAAIRQTVAY